MDYLAALNDLAPRFSTQLITGSSPLGIGVRIIPPADLPYSDPTKPHNGWVLTEAIGKLENVQVPINVDLEFVGKWLRSENFDLPAQPATDNVIGGMPVVERIPLGASLIEDLPNEKLMLSKADKKTTPGVPEVLGRVKGTISQTVEKIKDTLLKNPITVAVRWRVLDESTPGFTKTADAKYRTAPNSEWQQVPTTIELAAAASPAELSLNFPAFFSELTSSALDVVTISVQVAIKLTVTLAQLPEKIEAPNRPPARSTFSNLDWVELPPVRLVLPTIPIPTILVLCEHRDFGGRKLVLVPSNSIIGQANGPSIGTALEIANSALKALAAGNKLIEFLAAASETPEGTAASALKALIASSGQTIIAAQSRVDDLSAPEFVFNPGGWFGIGRFTADNMASSVICIGRSGTVFDMFQEPNLNEYITRFRIELDGRLGGAIIKLDTTDPGADAVYGKADPEAGYNESVVKSSSPNHHNQDRITSVSITSPTSRFLA